ncbi:hypothetical protein M9Y10_023465 [Tritrichomonas musculus]|uniref:Uncharacterized protein n=1 Tax=Tritrichomonas musculus TaxID=1915356 RepID=A0ABR2KVZ3_9EUKA
MLKKNKRIVEENNNLKRKIGKLEKDLSKSTPTPKTRQRSSSSSPSPIDYYKKRLLEEKMTNAKKSKSHRRYSNRTMMIAALLIIISLPCYEMIRKFDIWPSRQAVENRLRTAYVANTELLISLDNIHLVVKKYKDENSVDQKIKAILAVDAVSLTPEIGITKDKLIKGLLQKELLEDSEMRLLEKKFKEFEKFCRSRKDVTITDAFLFNIQPLNSSYRSFVVYFHASTQGKATDREVEILHRIKNEVAKNGIEIIGYAFDGDSTYRTLHNDYFNYYNDIISNSASFSNYSTIKKLSIISDPLHILKRARYRIFSGKLYAGFSRGSNQLNIEYLKTHLNVPTLVFCNKAFTKMQDSLPVELFSLESLYILLLDENLDWISYFLPFILLNSALSEPELTVDERRTFIEIALYNSFYYIKESKQYANPLPQRKSKYNSDLQMYNEVLMIEFCNTVLSILSVIDSINGTINLNRIGSNPVEHVFGLLRMKSRNKHTYDKMVKNLGEIELQKQLLKELGENQPVTGRKSYYGQKIFNSINGTRDIFEINPREIAFSLHIAFNLPIKSLNNQIQSKDFITKNAKYIADDFFISLKTIFLRLHPKNRQGKLNSPEIHLSSGRNIHFRLIDKEIVN